MPDAVDQLEGWGVDTSRGRTLCGIRYLDEYHGVDASARFPLRPGLGMRRTALNEALVARAEALGVELEFGRRVGRITADDGVDLVSVGVTRSADRRGSSESRISGRWLVGADGLHSRVRSWAGLDGARSSARAGQRFGVRAHFRVEHPPPDVEVHWSDACEAYVTPIGDDEIGVALLCDRAQGHRPRFGELLGRFPSLARSLRNAERTSRAAGAGPFLQRARGPTRGRIALVGDAAGYVDAITGEGLALSFHQAEALALSLEQDNLMSYAKAWRRDRRIPDAITRLVLLMSRSRRLRGRALRALERDQRLFDGLLALHVRAATPSRAALPSATRLAWRLALG